ncbi:MAG TPA: LysM peptidoglycan-binding domain-containing protein [Planctomycetaceae bacterium]|nr:LysM peptidoglycan-binding domain-containing protein [Planctomycetaceae bacterium]
MPRDLKIGLALGILLLGVVGAFFFRKESVRPHARLVTAEELDEQIASKSAIPYLSKPEFEADEPEVASRPALRQTPPQFELPEFLRHEDAVVQEAQLSRNVPAPDPIHDTAVHETSLATERPAPAVSSASSDMPKGRTHVIRAGDTLTGLAAKYLGNQARYEEIYSANRNLLADPNRLPVGTEIRIPDSLDSAGLPAADRLALRSTDKPVVDMPAKPPVSAVSTSVLTPTDASLSKPATESAPQPTEKKKFVPSGRVPFVKHQPQAKLESADREKTGGSATADDATKGPRMYEVKSGDTLARIAVRVYGRASRARDIYEANRDKLSSPNAVREGLQIVLP